MPTLTRPTLPVVLLVFAATCDRPRCDREDPEEVQPATPVGEFGASGDTHHVQCSGWFPDWIAKQPRPAGERTFQLSQGYPLGVPKLEAVDGELKIVGWDPYPPASTVAEAPWLAHDFLDPAQRPAYLDALKNYLLEGNTGAASVEDDFDVRNNPVRSWFHVPMMTTSPSKRREPIHGLTQERGLRDDHHTWIDNDGFGLRAYAIGAYNWLGGYTIGKVFASPEPSSADPAAGEFIDGTFVFKLLFAEYAPGELEPGVDPLAGSPEWTIQDNWRENNAPYPSTLTTRKVRLLQVDVAVKDPRATKTGWVFATYVYDKDMVAPTPWAKLRPVGLQWGDDAGDTTPAAIDESWLAPGVPSVYAREDGLPFGRDGRLNGPVDNQVSSCMSCHGTAQYVTGTSNVNAARGAALVPPGCTDAQAMYWFHDVPAGVPFGVMSNGGAGCEPVVPPVATPPLHSLDYSLQLADALESSIARNNPNPCAALAEELQDTQVVEAPPGDARAAKERELSAERLRDRPDARAAKAVGLPAEVLRKRHATPKRIEATVQDAPEAQEVDLHAR